MYHQLQRRLESHLARETTIADAAANFIPLLARAESNMALQVCSGCDSCYLRCSSEVPVARHEWEAIIAYVESRDAAQRAAIAQVMEQDKTVDLGDEVTVEMCRYFDMDTHHCMVYSVRPLACRLLGHVEWMPCPIEKVPHCLPTSEALELMKCYARLERRTFAEWDLRTADR